MYPYEHLMQKHLLYKYPTLGILLVLPPWVMSYQQPMGFIYHGSTNPISLSVTITQTYGRAQLPFLSQQSRQISDKAQRDQYLIMSLLFLLLQHCKRQQRSPNPHGNIYISDPCTSMPDIICLCGSSPGPQRCDKCERELFSFSTFLFSYQFPILTKIASFSRAGVHEVIFLFLPLFRVKLYL